MRVAEAAVAALEQHDALAGCGQVGEDRFPVFGEDLGAHGHAQHFVIAIRAGAVPSRAGTPVFRFLMLLIAIVDQRVEVRGGLDDHVAALAAVAAVRPSEFDEFLPPEADASRAAVAAADDDFGLVEEFHDGVSRSRNPA